jgi:hypothetical protein
VVGCGDVGMRLLPLLRARFRVFAVTSQRRAAPSCARPARFPLWPTSTSRTACTAWPAWRARWCTWRRRLPRALSDPHVRNVTAILPEGANVVYVSTTGVYGDAGGA